MLVSLDGSHQIDPLSRLSSPSRESNPHSVPPIRETKLESVFETKKLILIEKGVAV